MYACSLLHCAILETIDPSLGRADISSFSDQTLMELLIDGFEDSFKRPFRNKDGDYIDACAWPFAICDSERNVLEYIYTIPGNTGSVALEYIPLKMQKFSIMNSNLDGSISTQKLPDTLRDFKIGSTTFSGEVDFTHFPPLMEVIFLSYNIFQGSCDLTSLPKPLVLLDARSNVFSGSISLCSLPQNLKRLDLRQNELWGSLDFDKLPQTITRLLLSRNRFSGEFQLLHPPSELHSLHADDNEFSGRALVRKELTGIGLCLQKNAIEVVLDESGEVHPEQEILLKYLKKRAPQRPSKFRRQPRGGSSGKA